MKINSSDNFEIHTMKRSEVDIAVEWAKAEGWNPGINDAECFFAADPNGFFIGRANGEPVCCMSLVAYDDVFAFGGFYIVKKEYRSKGYGSQIFSIAMEHAKDCNVGGDGVIEMQKKYNERSGFQLAYRNIRFKGIIPQAEVAPYNNIREESIRKNELTNCLDVPFKKLVEYDTLHFPAKREKFLKRWINQKEGVSVAKMDNDESILGYGTLRKCAIGYKIGPLFADNANIAEDIFNTLITYGKNEPIFFDTPEPNKEAIALAKKNNMNPVFETARMYTKKIPELPMKDIYGITSYELG